MANPPRTHTTVDRGKELASRLGARLGNWNDQRYGPELGRKPHRRRWRRIDRFASWLYVWPDRPGGGDR